MDVATRKFEHKSGQLRDSRVRKSPFFEPRQFLGLLENEREASWTFHQPPFLASLAQVSFNVIVRLKTGFEGVLSLSNVKYPSRSN